MNFNFPHLFLKETESTNSRAMELLSKTNPSNGFAIITDYQTAGKGQYGRNWQSEPAKNLLFSLVVQPEDIHIHQLFRLHLATSVAIIKSLAPFSLKNVKLKWPNDIFMQQKKLGGILIQNQIKSSRIEWSVIGIGLNVNQIDFPNNPEAISLKKELGFEVQREGLIENIRNFILEFLSKKDTSFWVLLLEEYNQYLYLKNEQIEVTVMERNKFKGKIKSVNALGRLEIQDSNQQLSSYEFGEIKYNKIL